MPRWRRRDSKKTRRAAVKPRDLANKVMTWAEMLVSKEATRAMDSPSTGKVKGPITLVDVSEASLAKRTYTDAVKSIVPKTSNTEAALESVPESDTLTFAAVGSWADEVEESQSGTSPSIPPDPIQEEETVTPEPTPVEKAPAATEAIKFGFFDDVSEASDDACTPDEGKEVEEPPHQQVRPDAGGSIWFGDIEVRIDAQSEHAARLETEEEKNPADPKPTEPLPISELATPSVGQSGPFVFPPPFSDQPELLAFPQWSVSPIQWFHPAKNTSIQELVGGMGLPVTVGEKFDPDCYGLQFSEGCVRVVVHKNAACCWAKVLKPLKHECPECFRKDKVSAACIHDLLTGECFNPACPGVHYMNVCHGAVALMLAVVDREDQRVARGQSDPNGSKLWENARGAVIKYHERLTCHCMSQCGEHLWLPDHLEYTGFPRRAVSVYKGTVEKVLFDHYGESWCEIVDRIEVGSWN